MPKSANNKSCHSFPKRKSRSFLNPRRNIKLEPQVNLMVPHSKHLSHRVRCLNLIPNNTDHFVPLTPTTAIFTRVAEPNRLESACCEEERPIVKESFESHGNVNIKDAVEESVLAEFRCVAVFDPVVVAAD